MCECDKEHEIEFRQETDERGSPCPTVPTLLCCRHVKVPWSACDTNTTLLLYT